MPACLISASTNTPAKQPLPLLVQVFKLVGNKFKNTWWLPFCKALNGYSEGEQGSGAVLCCVVGWMGMMPLPGWHTLPTHLHCTGCSLTLPLHVVLPLQLLPWMPLRRAAAAPTCAPSCRARRGGRPR